MWGRVRGRVGRLAVLGGISLMLALAFSSPAIAAGPTPSSGTATVDGDPSEWAASDLFADMTAGGSATQPVRAQLSLRYDCATEVLYGLVLLLDGEKAVQTDPGEAYLRIDGSGKLVSGLSGNNGTPPDFSWVNGDGTAADGFEASGPLAPGTYTIRAHIKMIDDSADGYTSLDTIGRDVPLVIECVEPTATPTDAPTATPTEAPTPTPDATVEPTATVPPTATADPTASADPTATPEASVGGETGTPTITLPPTDTVAGTANRTPATGLPFVVLAAIVAAALIVPNPRRRSSR